MYKSVIIEDRVLIPPKFIGPDIRQALVDSLSKEVVGTIKKGIGVVLSVTDIKNVGEGYIEPENPGIFYDATYEVIAFVPELHEIVHGEVTTVTEFGAFINLGPIEGLCHISQITDDFVSFDDKQEKIVTKEANRSLGKGDKVVARITAVSLERKEMNKINLTMRQPGLGSILWIKEDEKKKEEEAEKSSKGE